MKLDVEWNGFDLSRIVFLKAVSYILYKYTGGEYNICEICFWEDDPFQKLNPYIEGGANHISLAEAQSNYIMFGACDKRSVANVRKSNSTDRRNPNWKPVKEDELFELKLARRKFKARLIQFC